MVEPEKKDFSPNLEDTVRNLREENAKLMQLLRAQGLLFDPTSILDGKSNDSSNISFDNSDISLTTNTINTTNQITHQHVTNHGPINQQNYSGQIIHGNQSNITPNFNTVIQTTTQPFVQNNSNTLVQNNTNLIQPINLVNFNNVSLDSIQSFLASQNNLVYLSQTSSSSTTTTTTTTTSNMKFSAESEQHQISIRPKPSILSQQIQPQQTQPTDITSVLPKVKNEYYDSLSRQLSTSSSSETTNLLDNDPNHKQPRPIRPKPSSRNNSLQVYAPVIINETKVPPTTNVLTPPSLLSNPTASSTVSLLSPSRAYDEHLIDSSNQFIQSKPLEMSVPPTNNLLTTNVPTPTSLNNTTTTKKPPNKNAIRNRKKTSTPSVIMPTNNSALVPIAPNTGRPLAPAPINVQRVVTTNKRSITNKKSNSKTFIEYHGETIIQQNSSPTSSFAESISGLMQNFDQELMAANFLTQPPTTNILSNDTTATTTSTSSSSSSSSNVNIIRALDNIDVRQIVSSSIHRTDSFQSMPTLDELNDRFDTTTNQTIHDYNVDNEQITSFMNEEDMRFVEMNFDENTFLKQFDLDDVGIKLSIPQEQNIFTSLLSNPHNLNTSTEQSNSPSLPPVPPTPHPPPPIYPGSSLINNNIFTTVVPLGSQQRSSNNNSFSNHINSTSRSLPEEGVQLTPRHIEPSQVATYESVKYQDILDDLVTVTDQDVLSHVQAAVAAVNDTTVLPSDFSFALLEATNEIIKTTEIHVAEETASAFVDLQYFYPIEQEQQLLQKQLEECEQNSQQEQLHQQQEQVLQQTDDLHTQEQPDASILLQEKFSTDMITSAESPKSEDHPAITDLTSILQINQVRSPSPIKETIPIVDYDALLPPVQAPPPPPPPPPTPPVVPSVPSTTNTTNTVSYSPLFDTSSRKACIIFEPILSPTNSLSPINPPSPIKAPLAINPPSPMKSSLPMNPPSPIKVPSPIKAASPPIKIPSPVEQVSVIKPASPIKSSQDEIVLESGYLEDSSIDKSNSLNMDQIEDLLNESTHDPYTTPHDAYESTHDASETFHDANETNQETYETPRDPYEIIENEGHTSPATNVSIENFDNLIEEIEQPTKKILEKNFLHYQQLYNENLKKKPKEQYSPIPSVKLKLKSIYPKHKKKRKSSPSPTPVPEPAAAPPVQEDIRPPLKIKIRTKLSLPPPPAAAASPPPPPPPPPIVRCLSPLPPPPLVSTSPTPKDKPALPKIKIRKPVKKPKRKKASTPSIDDQLEREAKLSLKTEYAGLTRFEQSLAQLYRQESSPDTRIPPTPGETEDLTTVPNKQDTPPTNEIKPNSSSPINHNKKLSHLLNYDDEPLNNNTFITPPPDIDVNIQQHQQQSLRPPSLPPASASSSQHHHTHSTQQQKSTNEFYHNPKKLKKSQQNAFINREFYGSSRSQHVVPRSQPTSMHINPYAQPYHHFDPRTSPFFNFPFANPFMNPHSTPPSAHFHHNPMKYHYPTHPYPAHQQQYPYHPHLQSQQQYNNSNYMSSHDHHSFDR